ncbi:hypothetical protein KMW40_25335 [Enterobacter cloacae]|uniref:hypothetical protein n=1 Tax=Enterobacter cloacae TaxID=550 RepID=UPI0034A40F69
MADHVSEMEIAEAVKVYEGECNRGAAQGKKAQAALVKINRALAYRGREYCTLTMARYGHARSLDYIRRGLVDDVKLNEHGQIVGKGGEIIPFYTDHP